MKNSVATGQVSGQVEAHEAQVTLPVTRPVTPPVGGQRGSAKVRGLSSPRKNLMAEIQEGGHQDLRSLGEGGSCPPIKNSWRVGKPALLCGRWT